MHNEVRRRKGDLGDSPHRPKRRFLSRSEYAVPKHSSCVAHSHRHCTHSAHNKKLLGASFRATSVWGVSPERHQGSFRLNGFCPPAPLFARRRRNLLKKLWGSPKRENETKRLQGRCDVTTTVAGKRAEDVFPSDEPSQLVGYGCFVLTLRYLWAGESQALGPPL